MTQQPGGPASSASGRPAAARQTLKPRPAAALIVLDRTPGTTWVLMGKRAGGHAFMPNVYVFPGGRRDARDHALPFRSDLHPLVFDKLLSDPNARLTPAGARAIALAAARELHEETGLALASGAPAETAPVPAADLAPLRYVARAITPPGHVRRFDTRFFCTFADESGMNIAQMQDSRELEDLRWVDIANISGLNIPDITRLVIEDVRNLMQADSSLPFGSPVPFYFVRYGRPVRLCV